MKINIGLSRSALALLTATIFGSHTSAADIEILGGQVILSGEIVHGDANRFESVVAGLPAKTIVRLQSPGGMALDGIRIGKLIRENGFGTYAPYGVCASACGLIWLGGVDRWINPNARVGFHQAYTGDARNNETSGVGNALVGAYMNELGYSDVAIIFATALKPNQMAWLSTEWSRKAKISYRLGVPVSSNSVVSTSPERSTVKPSGQDKLGSWTSIPSSLATDLPKLWRAVMTEFYGPYDAGRKCWTVRSSGNHYCMRPHKLEAISLGTHRNYYFVIGGYQVDQYECHVCTGNMGMLVLSDASKYMKLVAQNSLLEPQGSWGKISGEEDFELREIGKAGRVGWVIQSGYGNQGIFYQTMSVWAPLDGRFHKLAILPNGYGDDGHYIDKSEVTILDVKIIFTPQNETDFHPALLEISGNVKGRNYSKRFTAEYDNASKAYQLPMGLPDVFSNF